MVSISGVRGIVGTSLTPDVVVRYAASFSQYCNRRKVVIGRDGRASGRIIADLVSSTLLAMGSDVVALGVAPTPTIAIATAQLHAEGGIAITASHNPMEWNGLKFIGPNGAFLDARENERLQGIVTAQQAPYVTWENIGRYLTDDSYLRQHIDMVMNLPYIDAEQIKRRKFKVVVDCINAAGGIIVPELLRELGCQVIEMNCDLSGVFARLPEPLPENLLGLCSRVKEEKADLGIAVDPDVDRLVLITETGEPFGEEYTITSVVQFLLEKASKTRQKNPPPVVVNLSTTRAVDDVAKRFGVSVVRTPVGEINVVQKMMECHAMIGGEGSGGVILPAVHFGRDAVAGIGLILQQLAEFSGTLSELKGTLPQYQIAKSKIDLSEKLPNRLFDRIRKMYAKNGNITADDGLKFDFADSWVHLRRSNTEPIVRIIAEAPTSDRAQALVQQFRDHLLAP